MSTSSSMAQGAGTGKLWAMRLTVAACLLLTAFFALSPIVRGCFRQHLSYNEGWNIYNALLVHEGRQLYPAHEALVTNNYPMLSFVLIGKLAGNPGEWLWRWRLLSQLSTLMMAVLLAIMLREMGAHRYGATLGGLFGYALFAVNTAHDYAGTAYTNAADPEMLGLAIGVGALVLYVRARKLDSTWVLCISGAMFAVGLCVKHSQVALLLAAMIDCLLLCRRRWLVFTGCFAGCMGALVVLQTLWGGPWFLHDLLEPRVYASGRAMETATALLLPVAVQLACCAAFLVLKCRRGSQRLVLILFIVGLGLGFYFGSAEGVSINCFFSLLIALPLGLGLGFDWLQTNTPGWDGWTVVAPLALFGCLFWPAAQNDDLQPLESVRTGRSAQQTMDSEVAYVRARRGPALCEYLLVCFLAGKEYVYDPFNATRLIHLGRLDEKPLVNDVLQGRYSTIEVDTREMAMANKNYSSERFPQSVLQAITQAYDMGYEHDGMRVYIPRATVMQGEVAK